MSKKRATETGDRLGHGFQKPAIIAAVFLGLHVLHLFWRPNPMWGADLLFYMPASVQGLFILLAVLLFVPAFRRQIRSMVDALPLALWGRGRRVWVTRSLVLLVALAAFISLSSARHFLGDGYHLLEKFETDTWTNVFRAPLSFTLMRALHHAGAAFWESAENTYRIYSYTSGFFYILLTFPVATTVGKSKLEKSIVLTFLLTAGYMQFFFGYVENYALYMPVLLLYLLLGMRALENRVPLYVPAILLGMLLALHRAFAVFGPSLFFLAYRTWRHRQETIPCWKTAAATVAALCCVPVSAVAFLTLSGVGIESYLSGTGGDELLPLFAKCGDDPQDRIFSISHFLDFLNQQLLSAPTPCMALLLLRKKDFSHQPFLAISALVPLFFTFVVKSYIGAFRDWDIFSLPALPLTLCAAALFLSRIRDRERLFHGAFLFCGAAALHTLFWIGVNAGAGAAETRYIHLVENNTGRVASSGWETLAIYHLRRNDTRAALRAYKRARDVNPGSVRFWLTVSRTYRDMGQHSEAIENFKREIKLQPDHAAGANVNLGVFYRDMGEYTSAIEHLAKAIEIEPNIPSAYVNLGVVYSDIGQHSKAIRAFEKAVELRPEHATTYVNLGVAYIDVGQTANAIEALEKAVSLQPDDATAYGNLGAAYCDVGQFDNAMDCLKKALEIRPDFALAHANLGYVYRVRGQYPQAIAHLMRALGLHGQRADVEIYLNIGDTYYNMGEREKAITYFQKAIQLNPGHANAHLLLGMTYRALNHVEEARPHFEKVLKLESNHPHAAQIRQWLVGTLE